MPFLQVALNGGRPAGDHPALPVTATEIARDAAACAALGADGVHVHPRDADGTPSFEPAVLDEVVTWYRELCALPLSVTTQLAPDADPELRLRTVQRWSLLPDTATVNVSEPGWSDLARWLLGHGVGVEAGVWSVADAEALAASGIAQHVERVLVELIGVPAAEAARATADIHAALDDVRVTAPRLQHGEGETTWPVLDDALRRGLATRIGLEDTLAGPDGAPTSGNAELVGLVVARL